MLSAECISLAAFSTSRHIVGLLIALFGTAQGTGVLSSAEALEGPTFSCKWKNGAKECGNILIGYDRY